MLGCVAIMFISLFYFILFFAHKGERKRERMFLLFASQPPSSTSSSPTTTDKVGEICSIFHSYLFIYLFFNCALKSALMLKSMYYFFPQQHFSRSRYLNRNLERFHVIFDSSWLVLPVPGAR